MGTRATHARAAARRWGDSWASRPPRPQPPTTRHLTLFPSPAKPVAVASPPPLSPAPETKTTTGGKGGRAEHAPTPHALWMRLTLSGPADPPPPAFLFLFRPRLGRALDLFSNPLPLYTHHLPFPPPITSKAASNSTSAARPPACSGAFSDAPAYILSAKATGHVPRGADGGGGGVGQERVRDGRLGPAGARARAPPPPPGVHRPRRHLRPLAPRGRGAARRRRPRRGPAQALPRRPLRLPLHRRRRPRLLRPLLHVQHPRGPGRLRRGDGGGGGPGGAERAGGVRADGDHGEGGLHLLRHRRRLEGRRPQARRRLRREELERPQPLQETQAVARAGQDAVGEDGLGLGHGQRGGHGGHQRRPAHGAGALLRPPLPQGGPGDVRARRPRHRRRRLPRRRPRGRLRVPHGVRPLPLLQQRRVPARGRPPVRPDAHPLRSMLPSK